MGFVELMATLNYADVYGQPSGAGAVATAGIQVTGPNPSAVATQGNGVVSGTTTGGASAFSWVGFILLLLGIRILSEAS